MIQKQSHRNFEIKGAHEANLYISGYASVFNIEDRHGDVIVPGAFHNVAKQRKIKFLWQHDQTKPIGVINNFYEDSKGLFIEATINGSTQYGKDAKSLIEQGAIGAFSIGFNANKFYIGTNAEKIITEVDLWEVSLVTFPSNEEALITSISNKSNKNKGDIMNLRDERGVQAINTQENDLEYKNDTRITKMEQSVANIEYMLTKPDLSISTALDTKFVNFLRNGVVDLETKAMSSNANEDGGFMLRPEMYSKIMGGIRSKSAMRQLSSIETISSNALDVLVEEDNFVSDWVADAGARGDTDNAKVSQKRIHVHELYAQPKATQKLLDDSAINIENWIAEKLEDSFSRVENASFISGDGNNKPKGILDYGKDVIDRIDVADAGSITPEDILNLINELDEYYLSNATFLMNRTTLAAIQNLRDGNDRFLWQSSMSENKPGTLFGIPVVCSGDMPVFEADNLGIILADFKAGYKIVDKVGMFSLRDQYTEKPFVKFYTVKRVGGDVIVPDAIKVLKV